MNATKVKAINAQLDAAVAVARETAAVSAAPDVGTSPNPSGRWGKPKSRFVTVAIAYARCGRCGEVDASYQSLDPVCAQGHRWERSTIVCEDALLAPGLPR